VLRKAVKVAERWGLVGRSVVKLTDAPRVKRAEVQPLTPEEARRLLEAVKGDRWGALYTLAITTGLRQGEVLGLGWADVDLEAGSITVRRALQRVNGKLQFVDPKSERSRRRAELPPITISRLREHRAAQNRDRLIAGPDWRDTGLVFTTSIGTPLDGGNVTKRFQRILAEANLPRQRFHDLRHAYASYLISEGLGPRQVMEALGHSQISITMNTYGHIFPAATRESANAIQRALGG
jgi:integrase